MSWFDWLIIGAIVASLIGWYIAGRQDRGYRREYRRYILLINAGWALVLGIMQEVQAIIHLFTTLGQ